MDLSHLCLPSWDYDFVQAVNDPKNAILGLTTAGGVYDSLPESAKLTAAVYLEAIRDVARNSPLTEPGGARQLQTEATIRERTVFHELMHLFGMRHAAAGAPPSATDEGVMDSSNARYGSTAQNSLTDSQAAVIRKVYRP